MVTNFVNSLIRAFVILLFLINYYGNTAAITWADQIAGNTETIDGAGVIYLKASDSNDELIESNSCSTPLNKWAAMAINAHVNKDYDNAEAFAMKAIAEEPTRPINHMLLSAIYYDQGKKQMALDIMINAEILVDIAYNSEMASFYGSIGDYFYELSKYTKAIEYYKKALEMDNIRLPVYIGLANSYREIGKHESALEIYHKMLAFDDDYANKIAINGIDKITNMIIK